VGRRRARAARVDGLGDRDRSLSPDGEGAWETMLTTLTPDPQLPSAGSSFMSVSATTSGSSNAESTNTSLTTMGSTPNVVDRPNVGSEPVCDLVDDSSDTSDTSDTEDELYLHDRMTRERFQRSYADVVAARSDLTTSQSIAGDPDTLGGMQRIVRRLARREDIPDEWWAEAGLSRTFPQDRNFAS
jgi:hypothetical protein